MSGLVPVVGPPSVEGRAGAELRAVPGRPGSSLGPFRLRELPLCEETGVGWDRLCYHGTTSSSKLKVDRSSNIYFCLHGAMYSPYPGRGLIEK